MKLHRTLRINPALFNVVPLINVLFLVLFFYALGSTFVLQPGINVQLPASTFSLGPQRQPILVSLTASPVAAIYFEDRRVGAEQFAEELDKLRGSGRAVIIRADRSVPYDLVMDVAGQGLRRGFQVVLATSQIPP